MGSDVTGVYWAAGSMDAAPACSGCREYTTEISEINDSFIGSIGMSCCGHIGRNQRDTFAAVSLNHRDAAHHFKTVLNSSVGD